ncbi:hypothetical protein V8C86DRAFT_2441675 [Haematococcus lacustris]
MGTAEGYESKDRNTQFEQRKTFQRLLYVSQVFVARRDNARTVFRSFLEQQGGQLQADRHFLHALREKQHAIKLMDDTAAELVKEAARRQVEARLERACAAIRSGTGARDPAAAAAVMAEALGYSRELTNPLPPAPSPQPPAPCPLPPAPCPLPPAPCPQPPAPCPQPPAPCPLPPAPSPLPPAPSPLPPAPSPLPPARLANEADLVPGLGPVSLAGGPFMAEPRSRDRKELYKAMLALTPAVAQGLAEEATATLYSPESAMELHKSLYRSKLMTLLESKPRLTESEQAELRRIQRILCLPPAAVKAAQKETLGKQLAEALRSDPPSL